MESDGVVGEHRIEGALSAVSIISADGGSIFPGRQLAVKGDGPEPGKEFRAMPDSVVPEDRDQALAAFVSVADGSMQGAATTFRIVRDDGAVRVIDAQFLDHRNDPRIGGILVLSHDVTEEHDRAEILRRLSAAERLLAERARLVATVPIGELEATTQQLLHDVGELLGARLVTFASNTGTDRDRFILKQSWRAPGVSALHTEMGVAGMGAGVRRWFNETRPKWIDLERLAHRYPEVAARSAQLGDRALIYGLALVEDAWGLLTIWDPVQPPIAEFVIAALADVWSIVIARQMMAEQRATSEARLETLLAHSADLLIVHDQNLMLTYVSPGSARVLNTPAGQAVGRSLLAYLHPDDASAVGTFHLVPGVGSAPRVIRVRSDDGTYRTFEAVATDLRHDENVRGVLVNGRDVTDEASYREEIRRLRSLEQLVRGISTSFATAPVDKTDSLLVSCLRELAAFTDATRAAILLPDAGGDAYLEGYGVVTKGCDVTRGHMGSIATTRLIELAPALREGAVIAQSRSDGVDGLIDALAGPLPNDVAGLLAVPLRSGEELLGLMVLTSERHDWHCPLEYHGLLRTVGEIGAGALMRQRVERSLADGALRDPLTGLPNRRMLVELLTATLGRQPGHPSIALMFVDCDGFKEVNDTCGHEQGDRLLIEMALRLEGLCAGSGSLARFGGDEFVVMLEDVAEDGAIALAERIVDGLRKPYELGGPTIHVTVSVGVAVHSGAGVGMDTSTLLRRADLAMYQAKQAGRNRFQLFDDRTETRTRARYSLLAELLSAIESADQLEVWYQPIHRLRAVGRATESAAVRSGLTIRSRPIGELAGFEALVRWRHPTRGLLAPSAFIELAEESGAIDDLGWLVFDRAIEQLGRWRALGRVDATATMAVNVSVRQLQSAGLLDRIRRSLADRRLPAERITIEVTESVLADSASVRDRLQAMREMGLQIAIDDFGTGYSSLAYVRDFPVDILKIDRSFVSKLGRDSRDNAMVAMIVHLAEQMRIETVAEGVETFVQLDTVHRLGCSFAQGYLLGRPAPAGDYGTDMLTTLSLTAAAP